MFPFQVTQQVTNQRPGSSMTLISIKMVSVMGVTWLLGVAANVKALWFLWYPFVVLNSLQGKLAQLIDKTLNHARGFQLQAR